MELILGSFPTNFLTFKKTHLHSKIWRAPMVLCMLSCQNHLMEISHGLSPFLIYFPAYCKSMHTAQVSMFTLNLVRISWNIYGHLSKLELRFEWKNWFWWGCFSQLCLINLLSSVEMKIRGNFTEFNSGKWEEYQVYFIRLACSSFWLHHWATCLFFLQFRPLCCKFHTILKSSCIYISQTRKSEMMRLMSSAACLVHHHKNKVFWKRLVELHGFNSSVAIWQHYHLPFQMGQTKLRCEMSFLVPHFTGTQSQTCVTVVLLIRHIEYTCLNMLHWSVDEQ